MVTWTSVPPDRFLLKSGQDQLRSYASSPEVEWQFCGHCGSSLFYRASYTPDKVYVAAACLDELDQPPDSHVSFEEHLPWFDPAAPLPPRTRARPPSSSTAAGPAGLAAGRM